MQKNLPQAPMDTASIRPLDDAELEAVSGGFLYIPVVVGAFALGVGIRAGIDAIVRRVFN